MVHLATVIAGGTRLTHGRRGRHLGTTSGFEDGGSRRWMN